MKYQSYRYLFPPRPKTATAPTTLHLYEEMGWWSQSKLNGTCCVLYMPPDCKSFAMGRHGPDNKLVWQPGERWNAFEKHLLGQGWYVFVGELLHSKGIGVRDTMYLFDLLVDNGEYLIGETYQDRWERLAKLCKFVPGGRVFEDTHTVITPGVWLTENYTQDFTAQYESMRNISGSEGLVLKNPKSKLLPCGTTSANEKWQHKCRLTTKHLSF